MVLIRVVTVVSRAYRYGNMGKGCMTATKYFLFLLNLIFFVSISPQDASNCAEEEVKAPDNAVKEFTSQSVSQDPSDATR